MFVIQYNISQEICTRFLLCCALLWLYIDWFLALWQSNDCPSASKATLMNMDKYFMWIHYERLHNHSKAKHNKTVCIFLWIYCTYCTVLAYSYNWIEGEAVIFYPYDFYRNIGRWPTFIMKGLRYTVTCVIIGLLFDSHACYCTAFKPSCTWQIT